MSGAPAVTPTGFRLHDPATAPDEAKPLLAEAEAALGKVPYLERVMAEAPALLEAYVKTWAMFDTTSLSPAERQVVYQVANVANGCTYCRPWHAMLSKMAGMSQEEAIKLRDGQPLSAPKLEALREFANAVLAAKGHVNAAQMEAIQAAGYTQQQILEVVLGLAIKVMSNYTNAIAGTPLDPEVARWAPAAKSGT